MANRIALVVGNSTYDDPILTRLKTPRADAAEFAKALRDRSIGGFDEVRELIDPTESETRRAVGDLFARRHPRDLLVLYFSGHGVKDDRGRLHLALRDTSYENLRATALPSSYIVEHMDDCRSKRQVLILDCCNSGAFAKGTKGDPTAYTADTFAGNGFGRVVLTASDATQYALEGDQVIERAELSLFTHYLLEGLLDGRAARGQPWTTLDALYDYAYGEVVSHGSGQTPRKWVFNQEGSLVLARNPRHEGPVEPFPEPRPASGTQSGPPLAEPSSAVDADDSGRRANSPASRSRAWVDRLTEGKSPIMVWTGATISAFAAAGLLLGTTGMALVGFVPQLIAGVVEGTLLGLAQAYALQRMGRDVDMKSWAQWTAGAVVVRWQLPVPGFLITEPFVAAFRGMLDGALVGSAQSQAAQLTVNGRAIWTLLNVGGWALAYLAFQPLLRALQAGAATSPGYAALIVGAVTGTCVGGLTALGLKSIRQPATR